MRVLTPSEELPVLNHPSIFLAGPTPREKHVTSWRPDAIDALERACFEGDVLAPEPFEGGFDAQVAWEFYCLEGCSVVCFWVPRDLKDMPAFTTNVEFGRYSGSGKALYGRPDRAPKTRYLDWLYSTVAGKTPFSSLEELMQEAVLMTR